MNYNEILPDTPTVTITDLYLTAYLKVVGVPILKIDRSNSSKVRFVFPENAEKLILDFHNGSKVGACRYASAVEEIKGLIFDVH